MARSAGRKGAGAVESGNGSGERVAAWREAEMPVIEGGGFEACWGSVMATLGLILRQAFEEFERSKEPLETRTTTTRTRQTPRGVEVTETVTVRRAERVGDVKILKTLLQCLDREMRLLKELHGDPKKFVDDLEPLSDEELDGLGDHLDENDVEVETDGVVDAEAQSSGPVPDPGDGVDAARVDEPRTAVGAPDECSQKDAASGAATSETDGRPDDTARLEPEPADASRTVPVTRELRDENLRDQDKLRERLEDWLRETEAFLPRQPARSPAAASPTAALVSG